MKAHLRRSSLAILDVKNLWHHPLDDGAEAIKILTRSGVLIPVLFRLLLEKSQIQKITKTITKTILTWLATQVVRLHFNS